MLERHEPGGYLAGPPGHRMKLWGHEVRFNRLGMRDPEPRIPKPPGMRRLLVLGDSVAFGHGVAQDETFVAVLRERWRERGIDVVSGSRPGWNTIAQEIFFNAWVDALDPDLVAIFYIFNDREPTPMLGKTPAPAVSMTSRLHRWLVLHSRVAEEAAFAYEKISGDSIGRTLAEIAEGRALARRLEGEHKFAESDQGWIASREALSRMSDVMLERDGALVVYCHRRSNRKAHRFYVDTLAAFGRDAGFEVVDVWPFFSGRRQAELVVRRWVDPHPNALAHELIANGIERHLQDRGWLEGELEPGAQGLHE